MLDQELIGFFLEEAKENLDKWQDLLIVLEKDYQESHINALFRIAHNLKGTSKSVGLETFGCSIHKVEDVIVALKENRLSYNSELKDLLSKSQSFFSEWIDNLLAGKSEPETKLLLSTCEAILIKAGLQAENNIISIQEKINPNSEGIKTQLPVAVETMRIPVSKLDTLIQSIGELTTQQEIILHAKKNKAFNSFLFLETVEAMSQGVRQVHEQALSLRLQQIGPSFSRLQKTILDLARELDKKIDVEITGSDTELEKSILEKIIDPLNHMVRNAVDHGIESSSERQHKNPIAKVKLNARLEGSEVLLEISDDGRGLDPNKIFNSAVKKGLINENQKMSEEDIFNLIFLPGFSTAAQVTQISGRGVGMDVVKRTIEELNGKVKISSQVSQGTQFQISLPLSLSITDAIVVQSYQHKLCFPTYQIKEIIDLSSCNIRNENDKSIFYQVRDTWVICHDIVSHLFDSKEQSNARVGIRVTHGTSDIVFKIESILGQSSLLLRPKKGHWENFSSIQGMAILGDGQPAPVLDLCECVRALEEDYVIDRKKEEAA